MYYNGQRATNTYQLYSVSQAFVKKRKTSLLLPNRPELIQPTYQKPSMYLPGMTYLPIEHKSGRFDQQGMYILAQPLCTMPGSSKQGQLHLFMGQLFIVCRIISFIWYGINRDAQIGLIEYSTRSELSEILEVKDDFHSLKLLPRFEV